MIALLIVLIVVIGGYAYLTNSDRVRLMAESYLSGLVGGRVEVGSATLSLFEGLRLDDVRVHVDRDITQADSLIFSAQTFLVRYNPRSMLSGRLEATEIIAQKPHVHLTENVNTGEWNWHRLGKTRLRPKDRIVAPQRPMAVPQVLLRNARLEISEIRNGVYETLGSMAMEGQVAPDARASKVAFSLQSRGVSEGVGAFVSGFFDVGTGEVDAELRNFEFGRDIRSMLPDAVRQWWERHLLSGRLDIPVLSYVPGQAAGGSANFKVETDLNGVTLSVQPEEWLSSAETRRLTETRSAVELVGELYRVAGHSIQNRQLPGGGRRPPRTRVDHLADVIEPAPITLRRVSGRFIFTEDGITVQDVSGRVENNAFRINGQIHGYRPDSPLELQIASLESENIYIPRSPRYISSMPRVVRELYDQLQPYGTCALSVEVDRPENGARPQVSGRIDVIDGQFTYSRFKYPLRQANGQIFFGRDPGDGLDRVRIVNLRGRGIETGPNSNSLVTINGQIGPFGSGAGVDISILGENVASEAELTAAFPPEVQHGLQIFDAPGKGEFPRFRGKFLCRVFRPQGLKQHWSFDTDISIIDGSGFLAAFPYPLQGVSAELQIRSGYMRVVNAKMMRGDASLTLNGAVAWRSNSATQPADMPAVPPTDLNIVVTKMPIDEAFLAALPPDHRQWLQRLGVQGELDIAGKIIEKKHPSQSPAAEVSSSPMASVDYGFDVDVKNATLWPRDGTFAISKAAGKLRVEPDRLIIHEIKGNRGDAGLTSSGSISWKKDQVALDMSATASNLLLDSALYELLPNEAQKAWDDVHPDGSIDAKLHYRTIFSKAADTSAPATQAARTAQDYSLEIFPRELSVKLDAFPYRLDELGGSILVRPDKVTLKDVAARHGNAKLLVSGSGTHLSNPQWDLSLTGESLPADDELKRALPPVLSELCASLKVQGVMGVKFSKFAYRPAAKIAGATTRHSSIVDDENQPAAAKEASPEIDIEGQLFLSDGGLDVGVPLSGVNGVVKMSAEIRDGRLATMNGTIDAKSLLMAGRPMRNFKSELVKPPQQNELRLSRMHAKLAGGEIAGDVKIEFPDDGPSHYTVDMVVRDADVKELSQETETDVRGELTASLALEGAWGDNSFRRGRGDVVASGKRMYRVPLILGLLQVTNLAIPMSGPFKEATASYSVEGERVTFENIELRSDNMVMTGQGTLDFGTKKVRLTFLTDNPGALKVPLLNELLQGARQELFKIHVRGTVQEPKISAGVMSTFTTTVDEVLKGD